MQEPIIRVGHLVKSFGHPVLCGIDLEVQRGEIYGLIGPSGAGKTTLIRILTGELSADSGEISVMGATPNRSGDDFYRSIGVVFDTLGLFERLSAYQNLAVFARIYGIPEARVGQALSDVGLDLAANNKAYQLSRGMRQRLAIARAVLHEPSLLILDEPTSGLDPVNVEGIHRLIRAQRDRGATVFITTHRMDEAMKLCDRILLLNRGVVAEQGAPKEICAGYNVDPRVHLILKSGEELELPAGPEGAEELRRLTRADAIKSIHSTEPDLEEVFLRIAQRKEDRK